ncbi:MAG: hypothetical protein Q4G69_10265 [Planctomycetia bacterium]|nr:hypothetical protein [Planctomycetia bacterium]
MNRYPMKKGLCFLLALFAIGSVCPLTACEKEKKCEEEFFSTVNLAAGKKYTLSPAPTYQYCTDPDDKIQLTDGKTTDQHFWTQKGTVGWAHCPMVLITIDLGKVEPISHLSFTSAAGRAGVTWPYAAVVLVSEDGKKFFQTDEIMKSEVERSAIPFDNEKYAIRKITSKNLRTKGRFVQLALFTFGPFIFTDEIEIFRGPESLLQEPIQGTPIESIKEYGDKLRTGILIHKRYESDVRDLNEKLITLSRKGKLDELLKNLLFKTTETTRNKLRNRPVPEDPSFKTIFPYNEDHARLFALHGLLWNQEYGFTFKAEAVNRWEKYSPFDVDPGKSVPSSVDLIKGEKRSIAVNLYNAMEEPVDVFAEVDNKGKNILPAISLFHVPWTDTLQSVPVQAALVPVKLDGAKSDSITVYPGLAAQIWITIDGSRISEPGNYDFTLLFKNKEGEKIAEKNASFKLWPIDFPKKTSLFIGGWDYTNSLPAYSVNEKNLHSFLRICRENHVNAPWGNPRIMMQYKLTDNKNTPVEIDTKSMENWLKLWSDAKEYFIFLSAGGSFGKHKVNTPEFEDSVGKWAALWRDWFKKKGVDPHRIHLLVVDEPGLSHASIDNLVAWGKAIKKTAPEFHIWEDPIFSNPTKMPESVLSISDVLCPNRPQWLANPKEFTKYYPEAQKSGKTLHFYSCSGPVRLLDPYNYFLLQAWHCFQIGAKASFFWALGDGADASSWNEYLLSRNGFTPMFIDPNDSQVFSAKQLAAIGESAQDYEILSMLAGEIEKSSSDPKKKDAAEKAKKVLKEGVDRVLSSPGTDKIEWKTVTDRSLADQVRKEVLEQLLLLK